MQAKRLEFGFPLAAIALLATMAVLHASPTTQASDSAWSTTLTAFAAALIDSEEGATLEELVASDAVIRQFTQSGREDIVALHRKVNGMKLLTSRGYLDTPNEMASDIASDLKNSNIPESVKRRLTPAEDNAMRHANVTAAKWIAASLFTSGSEPVGVIVLWRAGEDQIADADSNDSAKLAPMPLFVLVKGELSDGRYHIRQIGYGNPVAAGE